MQAQRHIDCCRQSGRPLIFLDVDGVLNFPSRSAPEALEPLPLQNLVLLLRKTGAQIVLSSTWRVHDRLRNKLQQALWLGGVDASDWTATDIQDWHSWGSETAEEAVKRRCREIREYLTRAAPDAVSSWVVSHDHTEHAHTRYQHHV
jgi:hypothetical protein